MYSGQGSLVLEGTALPTVPQPLPLFFLKITFLARNRPAYEST